MGGGPQAVGTRAATRGFGCSSGAPCGGRGQSGRAVRCRAPSGTTRTSPRPPSKPSTRASTRPTPSTRRWNRSPPSQQTARRPSCIGSRPSPSAAAAATPGRALGRPQTEEAGCGWSERPAELRAELRSARLAPRPRNHRILGAVRLGRVGGSPCDSWGSGRSRPRSRRCATPGSPRRPGTRPTRRAAPSSPGRSSRAASDHHRDRRGR